MNLNMKPLIVLLAILAGVYLLVIFLSVDGYGYAGYGGYHRGPSIWYWGGPKYYHDSGTSVRGGSVGGPSHLGGGPGRGK